MEPVAPSSLKFSVRRRRPELIVPAKPTPCEVKKLSDIDDQEGLRFQFSFIMFYRSEPSMKGKDPANIIREALGEALVFYYPFAGRIIQGPNRKLMVDCNGQGILFIEADADITIEQLGDSMQPPCPCIEDLLYDVPGSAGILGCPLLLIQVTRLACGGFVLAIRLNHTMSDSLGLAKFLMATAEIARGARTPSLFPVWRREILNARDPPHVTHVHHEYEEIPINDTNKNSVMTLDLPNMAHLSFFFGPREMRSLRSHLPPHLRKCSTFELLTACLWKCRTIALELDPDEIVRLLCVINLRGKQNQLKVPNGYYGNAFAFPAALSTAGELCKNPLEYAIESIRKAKNLMSEEYIRSVADLMVIKGRPHYTTVWNFLVADTTWAGLVEVDFGWGKPLFGGPIGALPYRSFFSRFKNSNGEYGIVVPILLPRPVMKRFQDELMKMISEESMDDFYNIRCPRIQSML
ncbi:hypothetical protein P3X46_032373 [Hevea brasiliensis]|uniref:Uncharacterized protein n=1 Tax=Hevea brasiliensis TaxID=3981 RepID=A0ABQ9KD82_HEVBR|nr:methanol O-anthraniloyltransferase [Hevea brasiliensis]KAJ9135162.1 hypothetical protein P3X46_032373 [Hevea brasiliensis]